MKNLLPEFLYEELKKENYVGSFKAYSIFVDISKFTPMTEELMKNGSEGAEVLSAIVNKVFEPSIKVIYENFGFVSTFAGDAFTALFDAREASVFNVLLAAYEIKQIFNTIGFQKTRFGDYDLNVKIGLSYGDVDWGIISADLGKSYYIRGNSVDQCAYVEQHTEIGEICFDKYIYEKIDDYSKLSYNEKDSGYFSLNNFNNITASKRELTLKEYDEYLMMPEDVLNLDITGEFRKVTNCFISFKENENLNQFLVEVLELALRFGGYFNKIDFGDKGGVILVVFGAPKSKPHFMNRALEFAEQVVGIDSTPCRIGVSYGLTYAGFIGSLVRQEYTVMGNVVNLAARLMNYADYGQIILNSDMAKHIKSGYNLIEIENVALKGLKDPISVYRFDSKKEISKANTPYVNRGAMVSVLELFVNSLLNGNYQGTLYIKGDAGVGKSRLIDETLFTYRDDIMILTIHGEGIYTKNLFSIKKCLNNYFDLKEGYEPELRKQKFTEKYSDFSQSKKIRTDELDQHKEFLAALMDIRFENSVLPFMEPKLRLEGMMHAFRFFVLALSYSHPVIIKLEDFHLMDKDSESFIKQSVFAIKSGPIGIIVASRLDDNDSSTDISDWSSPYNELEITEFSIQETESHLKLLLGCSLLPVETRETIYTLSGGNPLYIEQLTQYLIEQNIFDHEYAIIDVNYEIPASIDSIILARFDKLNNDVKSIIKKASVQGRKFYIKLLANMILEGNIDDYLNKGVNEDIWDENDDINYSFKNTITHEAVYDMQLKHEVRELHAIVASEMEKIYFNSLDEYANIIAYQKENAGITKDAIKYYKKSADFSMENYQIDTCKRSTNKILLLNQDGDSELSIYCYKNLAEICFLNADYDDSIEYNFKALKRCKDIDDIIRIKIKLMTLYHVLSDKEKREDISNQIISVIDDVADDIAAEFYMYYGGYLHFHGNTIEGSKALEKGLAIADRTSNLVAYSDIKGVIAISLTKDARYDESIKVYEEIIGIKEKLKDVKALAIQLLNLGNAYYSINDFITAKKYYERSLEYAKKTSFIRLRNNVTFNLTVILRELGQYEEAEASLLILLDQTLDIGDRFTHVYIYSSLGLIYKSMDDYEKALYNLNLSNELSYEHSHLDLLPENCLYMAEIYEQYGDVNKAMDTIETVDVAKVTEKGFIPQLILAKLRIKFKENIDDMNGKSEIYNELLSMENDYKDVMIKPYYLKEVAFMQKDLGLKEFEESQENCVKLFNELYNVTPKVEFLELAVEVSKL